MTTYNNHIDPMVVEVRPCTDHWFNGRNGAIRVMFKNKFDDKAVRPWVCSSGHAASFDDIPSLRAPDSDPAAWIEKHATQVAKSMTIDLCGEHGDDPRYTDGWGWGLDGHLWVKGPERDLALCLPRTNPDYKDLPRR